MSICSSVFITREEAVKRTKSKLMYEHELLVDKALESMDDYELTYHLSDEFYDYNISEVEE